MRKLIILGAGNKGVEILKKYGKENVELFCDNLSTKWGQNIEGIPIVSFDDMSRIYNSDKHIIVVSPVDFRFLVGQLELAGIYEYIIYSVAPDYNHLQVLKDIENSSVEHNSILDSYSLKSQKWDLLEECTEFKMLVSEVLRKSSEGFSLFRLGIGEEGNYYGNLDALLKYANYDEYERLYAPNISHNALMPIKKAETMYNSAVVFSGNYYRSKIHRWRPYIPVFSVGSYIQYAEGIYSNEKINKIKRKNGKTLTVFLPHSIESVGRKYRKEDFINDVMRNYASSFDTILLSVYWADLLEPVCAYAESKGMKIVTSGFRFDAMFNRRLKSLLEITDAVVGGDIGTHYNYAYYMGKPAARVEISDNQMISDCEYSTDLESRVQFDEFYQNYKREFYVCYDGEFKHNDAQKMWLNPYVGYDIKRSPEYIKNIFDISKDILLECDGDLKHYPNAVKSVYRRYQECNDIDKISILVDSTGSYLYF